MKITTIGLAEWRLSEEEQEQLTAIGLGSCVALVMYDPLQRVGAMAHIMLPSGQDAGAMPAKYANVAVPYLLQQMLENGASVDDIGVGLFGGASMLGDGSNLLMGIGDRNVAAVRDALTKIGLSPRIEALGGQRGRTVTLRIGSGEVVVRILGEAEEIFDELTAGEGVQR